MSALAVVACIAIYPVVTALVIVALVVICCNVHPHVHTMNHRH